MLGERKSVYAASGCVLLGLALLAGAPGPGKAGGPLDPSDPIPHWEDLYKGSNDGRTGYLEIVGNGKVSEHTMEFIVKLLDEDRDVSFEGLGYVDYVQGEGKPLHVMYFKRPLTGPSGTKTVNRLDLHTWDNDYVSGTTEWKGTRYGAAFEAW
jgi:hypothetical protein